jgi:hypothetical protein
MKVAAGICEYADTDGLYRCLNSLGLGTSGGIDKAIIVHGKFNNFNLDKSDAYEQTLKIISRFPSNTIHLINPSKPLTEIESRNLYLKAAADLKCDWLLVIDSDEFLAHKLTDFTEFRRQLQYVMDVQSEIPSAREQIFDIQLEGSIPAYRGPQPRLFLRPQTIKYWGKHYWFVLEETKKLYKGQSDAARVIGGIVLCHDHTIRDSSYYNASIGYKEWQQEHEGEEVIITEKQKQKQQNQKE